MYTVVIKNEDGTSTDYCTINDEEYKAVSHICVNGVPCCRKRTQKRTKELKKEQKKLN